jgi:hypothetical protein
MHAEKNEGASMKKPNVPTYRKAGYGAGSMVVDRELAPVGLSSCVDVHIFWHKKTSGSAMRTRGTISSIPLAVKADTQVKRKFYTTHL